MSAAACLPGVLLGWEMGNTDTAALASIDSLGLQAVASGNTAEAQAQATAIANSGSASAQASEHPCFAHSTTTFTFHSTPLQELL